MVRKNVVMDRSFWKFQGIAGFCPITILIART
jgi:hypothetical protein